MFKRLEIYTTHGIVEQASPIKFIHRNLLDRNLFERFLINCNSKFNKLQDVIKFGGSALTIDDSTKAAGDAAILARTLGHEITLFVNPENIIRQIYYPLSQLNFILDNIEKELLFDDIKLEDLSISSKKIFRKEFKGRLNQFNNYIDSSNYIKLFADQVNICIDELPHFLHPLTFDDLLALLDYGVNIQNHGWSHLHYANLKKGAVYENISRGRQWFKQNLEIDTQYFAVPFGDVYPTKESEGLYDMWFLLQSNIETGCLGNKIFNRQKLKL